MCERLLKYWQQSGPAVIQSVVMSAMPTPTWCAIVVSSAQLPFASKRICDLWAQSVGKLCLPASSMPFSGLQTSSVFPFQRE